MSAARTKINVSFTHDKTVATLTLADGKGNILDKIMMQEILSAFDEFERIQSLKLIVIEGEGKHFSFGASVEEHKKEAAAQMLQTFHSLFFKMADMAIPMLAKISGQCLGGGLEFALGCHFIFTDSSAWLGQPEIVLGVFAPPASVMLPLKIGQARAEEMLLTGSSIPATKAQSWGLLNEVFETREEMDSETEAWIAKHILPKSASSLRYAVRAARNSFNEHLRDQLKQLETLYLGSLMETHDANEGIASFIQKRPPDWKNN